MITSAVSVRVGLTWRRPARRMCSGSRTTYNVDPVSSTITDTRPPGAACLADVTSGVRTARSVTTPDSAGASRRLVEPGVTSVNPDITCSRRMAAGTNEWPTFCYDN